MAGVSSPAVLGQIALNVYDLRMRDWYARVFGFVYAGATDLFFGPTATRVQGIPRVAERCKWLIDSKRSFQLEFFKFLSPRSKPRRPDERLSDVGYRMMGIHVRDFDDVLYRLAAEGTAPLTAPFGTLGDRRFCVRDPEGNLLEVFERDPLAGAAPRLRRPEIPATVRTITLTVPRAERLAATLEDVFGLERIAGAPLHEPRHSELWGLAGESRHSVLLRASGGLVELVEYREPAPRPWPDGYRICDQGYMNMAFLVDSAEDFARCFARAVAAGLRPNGEPLDAGVFKVMYVNDPQGFSIEILYPRPWAYRLTGFVPSVPYVEEEVSVPAPPARVWELLSDHERMGEWTSFRAELVRPGARERNGVGALRRLSAFGSSVEEEIVEFVPERLYSYRLLRGLAVRNHRGTILLIPERGGTRVRWAVTFEPLVPGTGVVIAEALRRGFRAALAKLAGRFAA